MSTHLYELLSLAIQCYGHYALLRSMDRVDTFPDAGSEVGTSTKSARGYEWWRGGAGSSKRRCEGSK